MPFRLDPEIYKEYWYWVNERHSIYLKKEAGLPKPWSEDPIFQKWKFCNVFRSLDTQSKWLIENVIKPHWDAPPGIMLFNIFLFRAFNLYQTYEAIGWVDKWNPIEMYDRLEAHVEKGYKYTSGAYMLRGRQGYPKFVSILATLDDIWAAKDEIITDLGTRGMLSYTMRATFQELMRRNFWGWGTFTIYQIVLDMIESPLLQDPSDLNEWVAFGPGARKGIKALCPTFHFYPLSVISLCKQISADQKKYKGDHVPAMTIHDVEFALCELSKYLKIKKTGRGSDKYAGT